MPGSTRSAPGSTLGSTRWVSAWTTTSEAIAPQVELAPGLPSPGHSPSKPVVERNLRLPAELGPGEGDVGAPPLGVVLRPVDELELRGRTDRVPDPLGELAHRDLLGVPEIDRPGAVPRHQPPEPLDQVAHVAERPGLRALAMDRDRLTGEGLTEERRHGASVSCTHPLSVRVEDPADPDRDPVRTVVRERGRLGEPLRLVVHAPRADRVHPPPVGLGLRGDLRIAVDLGGRREDERRARRARQTQAVVRPDGPGLQRLDPPLEVVDRRGGRGEVEDPVYPTRDLDRLRDVALLEREPGIAVGAGYVPQITGRELVEAEDFPAFGQEPLAQVRAEETGAARDDGAGHRSVPALTAQVTARSRRGPARTGRRRSPA